ncbi:hypothetical protein AHiyo8_pI69010 (plasmid) [Arthrobacter sp. Hiyo8]|nr:hypothetical protein AHiyo8_pI69010 [Arthrobacter sp. Hiyo8]
MPTGVTLGALTGRLAAEEITTGKAPKLLEGFRPSRAIEAANEVAYPDQYAIKR